MASRRHAAPACIFMKPGSERVSPSAYCLKATGRCSLAYAGIDGKSSQSAFSISANERPPDKRQEKATPARKRQERATPAHAVATLALVARPHGSVLSVEWRSPEPSASYLRKSAAVRAGTPPGEAAGATASAVATTTGIPRASRAISCSTIHSCESHNINPSLSVQQREGARQRTSLRPLRQRDKRSSLNARAGQPARASPSHGNL